jgi:hypothetical protein
LRRRSRRSTPTWPSCRITPSSAGMPAPY